MTGSRMLWPSLLFSLKAGSHVRGPTGKEYTQMTINEQALLNFFRLTTHTPTLFFVLSHFSKVLHFSSNAAQKHLGFMLPLVLHFFMKVRVSNKTDITCICKLFSLICLLLLGPQLRT